MSGAVVVIQQNRALRSFRAAGAHDAASAVTPHSVGVRENWIFRRMVARGVFVEVEPGRFYVDEPAAQRFIKRRRLLALTFVAIGVIAALVFAVSR